MGCSSDGSATAPGASSDKSGEIGLSLQVAGLTINSATDTIVGPNAFSKTGTIDLSAATAFSATIGGIPAGTGYSISLSATATDGTTQCAGSATFDVAARATTSVSVALDCHQAARTGSIGLNGVVNVCPVIDALSANPSQVNVGSSIALAGSAHDSDSGPSPVSYHWSATSGTFNDPTLQNPTFTCTGAGPATITLLASDGDTTPGRADTLTAIVTCSQSTRKRRPRRHAPVAGGSGRESGQHLGRQEVRRR